LETSNETTPQVVIDDPKAVLDALDRAKNDAKKFREEKEKLEIDLNSRDQKIAEFSGKLLREKVTQQLSIEGIKDPKRLLKFVDLNSLEFDENLEIVGFADQLQKLKEDLPELFDAKLRVGGQGDGAAKTSISTNHSASQLQAAKILGRI
jgi:hypothetical protein